MEGNELLAKPDTENITLYRRGNDSDCLSVAVRERFHFAGIHCRRSRGGLACGLTSRSETAIQGWGELGFFSTFFGVLWRS